MMRRVGWRRLAYTARNTALGFRSNRFVRPGHFYSPFPSAADVTRALSRSAEPGPEIDLRVDDQLALLGDLAPHAAGVGDGERYVVGNPQFSWSDAAVLRAMLTAKRPARMIEVGSGFSSAQALDTSDTRGIDTEFTFIDPYTDRLLSTLRPGDRTRAHVIAQPVQDVDAAVFSALASGDFLFIDSTHVAKAGSDVNHLYFTVLPSLASGVWVHVHDIFWPFEYPQEWFDEGRAWNEVYLLRALLTFTRAFRIELFSDFVAKREPESFAPFVNPQMRDGQGSIWLRVV